MKGKEANKMKTRCTTHRSPLEHNNNKTNDEKDGKSELNYILWKRTITKTLLKHEKRTVLTV